MTDTSRAARKALWASILEQASAFWEAGSDTNEGYRLRMNRRDAVACSPVALFWDDPDSEPTERIAVDLTTANALWFGLRVILDDDCAHPTVEPPELAVELQS